MGLSLVSDIHCINWLRHSLIFIFNKACLYVDSGKIFVICLNYRTMRKYEKCRYLERKSCILIFTHA